MLTTTRYFLVVLLIYSTSAQETRCFPLLEEGSLCFTKPVPTQSSSWSNALQWCKNIGATLPIVDNHYHNMIFGNAIDYFGLDALTVWLGANSTYNLNEWFWAGGKRFTGTIEQINVARRSHAYFARDGNTFKFVAEDPWEYANVLCQTPHSEVMCASNSYSYWTSGKCYKKQLASATWYDAWYSCGLSGGGLAVIDNVNDFSRWLDDRQPFWIDLRSTWWTWQDVVTGNSFEVTESLFHYLYPDGSSAECLASFRDWPPFLDYREWKNQNCGNSLQFICQQYVSPTTIGPTTDTTAPTSPPTTIFDTSPTTMPETSVTNAAADTSIIETTAADTSITETITITSGISTNAPGSASKSTDSRTTLSGGKTATASSRDAYTSTVGYSNSESDSINYALPFGLAVGIGGGLLMGVIVWVSVLTVQAHKKTGLSRTIKVFPQ